MNEGKFVNISHLEGAVLSNIEGLQKDSDHVTFTAIDGRVWRMFHSQDCCETVYLEDVNGEVGDLIGTPILQATEVSNTSDPALEPDDPDLEEGFYQGSHTWTFYRLSTIKGTVVIRWYGTSNGYYSEGVDIWETGAPSQD